MAKIKAVLFDLDGTLINTLDDLAASVNYALNRHGFAAHPTEAFRYFVGDGALKMVERALPESARDKQTLDKMMESFLEHYTVHSQDKTAAYDGIETTLQALRSLNIKMAVVTNKPDAAAQALIADMFAGLFDTAVGQRDGVPTKPDPAMPLCVMQELGVAPEECLFVGDSGVDILTGVNSGAYPVGVLWGFRDEAELVENGARSIVSKPEEILEVLADLSNDSED